MTHFSEKALLSIQHVFGLSPQNLYEIFLILRRIERDYDQKCIFGFM